MIGINPLSPQDSASLDSIAASLRRLVALTEKTMRMYGVELPPTVDEIAADLQLPDPPPMQIRDEEAEAAEEFLQDLKEGRGDLHY